MRAPAVVFRGEGWGLPVPLGLSGPREVWSVAADEPSKLDSVLRRLDDLARSGDPDRLAAGYLTYEAGVALEGAPGAFRPPDRTPLAWFAVFSMSGGRVTPKGSAISTVDAAPPASSLGPVAWKDGVEAIRDAIARGDVYQVNLTRRLTTCGEVDPHDLSARLWLESPAPYAVMIAAEDVAVVSNSPELFLDVDLGARVARSGPIKGTAPRGETPARDAALARGLLASRKDAAEHVMIVDLMRHDLGRVAVPGGVSVSELKALRTFSHLHHLVSVVEARLSPGARLSDLLRATLPAGSITGAPKRAALGFIRRLEPVARGPYCGAIGYVRGDGRAVFNVGIRTAVVGAGRVDLHAGGGIVWDSDPDREWEETETKAREGVRVLGRLAARKELVG